MSDEKRKLWDRLWDTGGVVYEGKAGLMGTAGLRAMRLQADVEDRKDRKEEAAMSPTTHRQRSRLHMIEDEALRYGIVKVLRNGRGTPAHWRIACSWPGCAEVYEPVWDSCTSPDLMIKNMRKKQWAIEHGKPPKCPVHARVTRITRVDLGQQPPPQQQEHPREEETAMTAAANTTDALSLHPKIARQLFLCLEDNLDMEAKAYKPGWDDARVAKECGTSERVVADVRTKSYFELSDPEIAKLETAIAALRVEVREFCDLYQRNLNDLNTKLYDLVKRRGAAR